MREQSLAGGLAKARAGPGELALEFVSGRTAAAAALGRSVDRDAVRSVKGAAAYSKHGYACIATVNR